MPKNKLFLSAEPICPTDPQKFIQYELLDEALLLKTRERWQTANNIQVMMGVKRNQSRERVGHEESSGYIFRTLYRPEVPLMSLEVKTCVLWVCLI